MTKNEQFNLLRLLETNSRINFSELAALLGIDETVVREEVAELEQQGVICGYHTIVNWDKTDDDKISAMIELRVTPQRGNGYEKIAQSIYNYPEVESLYLMSGAFDFMVITRNATMKEIATFVNRLALIDEVITTSTYIVLGCYKSHGVVLNKKDAHGNRLVLS